MIDSVANNNDKTNEIEFYSNIGNCTYYDHSLFSNKINKAVNIENQFIYCYN